MAASTMAWSYSRLNDFETCPRMFQGKYVTKDFPKENFDQPHLKRGREQHEKLENALNSGKLPSDLLYLQPLIDMALRRETETHAELQLCFDVNLHEISWFDKRAWCRVIFDAVIIAGDTAVIIDWKTGKVKDKARDQLALFAAAAMTKWPQVQRVITAFFWIDHPKQKPTVAEYTRLDLDHLWSEFIDRSEMIQITLESGEWLPKQNPFCKWCPALPGQCKYKK